MDDSKEDREDDGRGRNSQKPCDTAGRYHGRVAFFSFNMEESIEFLLEPSGIVILWFNEIYRQNFFAPRQPWNEFFHWPKEQKIQQQDYKVPPERTRAASGTVWYYPDRQRFPIITKHEMNLKRPIFAK